MAGNRHDHFPRRIYKQDGLIKSLFIHVYTVTPMHYTCILRRHKKPQLRHYQRTIDYKYTINCYKPPCFLGFPMFFHQSFSASPLFHHGDPIRPRTAGPSPSHRSAAHRHAAPRRHRWRTWSAGCDEADLPQNLQGGLPPWWWLMVNNG